MSAGPSVADLIKVANLLPLELLSELYAEIGRLLTKRSTEESEVAAARAAGSAAVDALESAATKVDKPAKAGK
jgi:predicted  nucleic acid-binding Zn-ribbon protein